MFFKTASTQIFNHFVFFSASSAKEEIWIMSKKPKGKCFADENTATLMLIDLIGKSKEGIQSKSLRKDIQYKHIAEKLVEAGFNLGAVPAEKCKNKWNNLKKNVKTFLDNAKKTGAAPMDKPQFYEEVMAVIYDDPSITLSNIVDTSKDETIEREGPTIVLETVSEDDKENHRKKATSPITPPPAKRHRRQTMAETLKRLDELKKNEEENKKSDSKFRQALLDQLKKDCDVRERALTQQKEASDRFLSLMEALANKNELPKKKKGKKRKGNSSSDSD